LFFNGIEKRRDADGDEDGQHRDGDHQFDEGKSLACAVHGVPLLESL
jgi:hypothetical protein